MGAKLGLKVWISQRACSKGLLDQSQKGVGLELSLKINEIFFSIQGESSWVGHPTVFVRTSGCHLRCTYCDTQYAYYEGHAMSVQHVLDEVAKYNSRFVCLTGGEPLLQAASFVLLKELCDLGYRVSLETSGDKDCTNVDPRVKKIIDIKTPDSGAPHAFNTKNVLLADAATEFKFVICSESDFTWSEQFAEKNELFKKSNVLYSPSFKITDERWLAEKILQSGSRARMQVQLHKYIWSADARGV